MFETLDWKEVSLEKVADEITVGYVGPMAAEYVSIGIPFLRSTNIQPYQIDLQDVIFINPAFHSKIRKSALKPGDVVIVRTGKPGTAAVIPDSLPIANCSDMVIVRPGENLDARFLAYYVNSVAQGHIAAHIVGAVQQHFNVGSAKQLKLRLPPLPEQRAIARILGALDDKIELNQHMNATLETMAQTLFKSWFVDFDPVTAKAEGRALFGMSAETAALFPAEFVDSALGAIPSGWKVGKIGDIANVIDCLHAKKPERQESGQVFLQLNNIRDDGLVDLSDIFHISEDDYQKWISRLEASEGDCVITNVGRVGAVAQIPPGFHAALGRNMTAIRCKDGYRFPTFLITCLMSDFMREEINIKTDTGTILDALNVKNIPLLRFALAPKPVLSAFEKAVRPLRAHMEANLAQSRTLASIRDALLPRLLGGELRVKA